ncbi:MAG: protein translocase subunit SecF [Clostridia bacterium]|nr:protein translocase subunit SecF [Clostridia bacterium]
MSDKKIDFYGKRKVFFGISIAIIVIGIIFNIIFGVTLDIQFSGGSMISYTYNGTLNESELKDLVQEKTPDNQVTFSISKNLAGNNEAGEGYYLTIQFSGKNAIDAEVQSQISTALEEKYPDNNFEVSEFSSVDPTMGTKFFVKCLVAVAIASVLMVIYVTFRFKKIGGMSAGMMGLAALFHDMVIVYIVFVLFRMPIDSNFIAVILMILGYSLNDTIVIYDRIRENKAKLGPKAELVDVYNLSMTQCIRRTIFTSITTLVAIGSVYAVCLVYNITSIQSFALPMMFGVISGCYSSICIASPLWVIWQMHKKEKEKITEKK